MSTINPFGKKITSVTADFCGKPLTLEVNRVGFRTSASVLARYGDTVVMGTAMVSPETVKGLDYFPLSIDYEEKFYAAGKISGSRFIKREGRPSDEAVLIGRLIDRPIRPLWPKGYRHEVQGVATVLSMDPNFRPDSIAMIAMSAAFTLTGVPFEGPVAGARVGLKDGKPEAFLTLQELDEGELDLVVAGTRSAIMMVEAGAREVSEQQIVKALDFAHKAIQPAIKLQEDLAKKVGAQPQQYELLLPDEAVTKNVNDWVKDKLGKNLRAPYPERNDLVSDLRHKMHEHFRGKVGEEEFESAKADYDEAFDTAVHKDVREGILAESVRPDGRALTEIRPLSSEVGFLPRAHGSSLFTRGVTQAMNIITLAPLSYAQMVDTMEREGERRFLHHYNAPGYTVGEVRRLGSPGRREIGHGYLAERALMPVLPAEADFPYTIRSVTEIMSQNGSTSMAATCSSCMALMDAGVPISAPVSGIAMGLMTDGKKSIIMSDIADAEDFAGDMDFKVAGTEKGVTALQMDMKVHGLPVETLKQALEQSKEGRAEILRHMLEVIPKPRAEMSPHAPRVEAITINPEKIREVIGKGGETINKIIAETGAEIDIKDDGTVMIASPDKRSIDAAIQFIRTLTEEPEVGRIYEDCRVVSVLDFGAFVEILPGKEGLVHVSEMKEERVEKPSDVVKEGDRVTVKLVAVDDRGRLQLSMKAAAREMAK
ncbi:polyribonucleotide nucleotidyltransferase [Candidatus Saccharibacteria bacterium RIFCSPHIGHO2_12_FULL_49_19]|nr:MAG: polyribonucleotide nucleotidyltransferase [Candidatus Saccharibacteria bacterium RIFCSPHIGHO2_01_FULL_49_21]OGL36484.1 MAG: polyribonucleotide nucleotidyltransferase [Candidatus Saccharibacteria bacterium RIFCSPHIGHO2_12_FULL_49_19]OGL38223.1 MAG: polyribonucleotide nucleotidyltransferase [Candidatus Saccharibacteria bacterium RIFCSPLOWO2_01_FULL_49_22]